MGHWLRHSYVPTGGIQFLKSVTWRKHYEIIAVLVNPLQNLYLKRCINNLFEISDVSTCEWSKWWTTCCDQFGFTVFFRHFFFRYWDTLLDSLWPRFMKMVELNAQSVKQTDPQKLGNIDIQPHYVSFLYFSNSFSSLVDAYSVIFDAVHGGIARLFPIAFIYFYLADFE